MKVVSTRKKSQGKKSFAPAADAIQIQNQEVPPDLEIFQQMQHLSPVELMKITLPEIAEALDSEPKKGAYAGVFWGLGLDMGVPLPDFAKLASERAWQAMKLDFLPSLTTDPGAAGKLVELANLAPQIGNPKPMDQAMNNLIGYIKTESGNLSVEEQEKYVMGRKAAQKIIKSLDEKATNERVLALFCIARNWREVEQLGSRNKTFKWLKEQKTPHGRLLLSPRTGWDEVKDWLAEINLPKGKPGAPKKIRTPAKSENPVSSKKRKSGL